MTIRELLEQRARELPDKTFLYWKDEEVSYKRLNEIANSIGNALLQLKIKKGDKICLLTPNRPEFIYSWLGIMKIGAVAVPINTLLKADEISFIIGNSDASVLITVAQFREVIERIKTELKKLKKVVIIGLEKKEDSFIPFSQLMAGSIKPPKVRVKENDDAAIIYTSGTTGKPKGVVLTHRNYYVNADQIADFGKMTENDRTLCILPLFHVNAQVVTTLAPMFAKASMILMEGFSPKDFLPALSRYKATTFSGVPTVYAILNSLPDAEKYDLSSLRFCICGAAPMPVEVFKTFEQKYKAYILEGYGLSEGTCGSSGNPLDKTRKIGSIGVPFKEQDMKIVDDKGRELPPGKVGEIVIKGKNVMKGYYKNIKATRETIKKGWLYTGDLGYRDEDGYFFIVGRKKEMIIRGGENIYPKEIEEVLYKHPRIQEAAVVGIPDKKWGEEVVAFIVPKQGQSLNQDDVIAYCKEHIADYKCPRRVEFRESLPKTATGKIQKPKIVEDYAKALGIDIRETFAVKK